MNHLSTLIIQLRKESSGRVFAIAKNTSFNTKILQFLYRKKYIEMYRINTLDKTVKIYFNTTSFGNMNLQNCRIQSTPGNKIHSSYKLLKSKYKTRQGTVVTTDKGLKQVYELKDGKCNLGGVPLFTLPRIKN